MPLSAGKRKRTLNFYSNATHLILLNYFRKRLCCGLLDSMSCFTWVRALSFAAIAIASRSDASPENAIFRPGRPLHDFRGDRIYAGGANVFFEDGIYWLVGEGQKVLPGVCSECFNLYSSNDLASWTNRGCILKNEDIVAPGPKPSQNYRMGEWARLARLLPAWPHRSVTL